jgi:predicted permease
MKSTGVMIQAALRGNLAFVGLPIVLFTLSTLPEVQRTEIEAAIVLAMTFVIIVYSILCVTVLVFFNREEGAKLNAREFWTNVLKNPLAIGCISGVIVNQLGIPLPLILSRTCEALSPAAFPMALLGIGSQLAATRVRSHVNWAIIASIVKTVISPLIGYAVGRFVGLSGIELTVAVLFCAMPTAVSSYILAEQMDVDPDLAASAVVICTVLSFFSLSAILLIPL